MNQKLINLLKIEEHWTLYQEIVREMNESWQIKGIQSVMDHGRRVCEETEKIINQLREKSSDLPLFLTENSDFILENLVNPVTRHLYTVFHDCGKPFCEADP